MKKKIIILSTCALLTVTIAFGETLIRDMGRVLNQIKSNHALTSINQEQSEIFKLELEDKEDFAKRNSSTTGNRILDLENKKKIKVGTQVAKGNIELQKIQSAYDDMDLEVKLNKALIDYAHKKSKVAFLNSRLEYHQKIASANKTKLSLGLIPQTDAVDSDIKVKETIINIDLEKNELKDAKIRLDNQVNNITRSEQIEYSLSIYPQVVEVFNEGLVPQKYLDMSVDIKKASIAVDSKNIAFELTKQYYKNDYEKEYIVAKNELEIAKIDYKDAKEKRIIDIRTTRDKLIVKFEAYTIANKLVNLYEEKLKHDEQALKLGKISQLDYYKSKNELIDKKIELIDSVSEYNTLYLDYRLMTQLNLKDKE